MIYDRIPLTLNEVDEIVEKIPDSERKDAMKLYLKKFLKATPEKAKKIKEEVEKLDILKIKREHVVKIVDLLPKDTTDLNKVFTDVSLNEDEATKILDIVKSA
jgi:DNA-directed RNA polymerase subunit F